MIRKNQGIYIKKRINNNYKDMNRLKNAIEAGKFAWEKYLNGKTWNGIMIHTQPLFCGYGQIGYQVFVYDRERHAATFTYDWEKRQIKFFNN